jgi:pimeloyl-ACP methyl ester carboxylesterase
MKDIREFQINIPQQELDDLHRRLDQTRFPEAETTGGWSQGLPLEYSKQLCTYWRGTYDWRSRESYFNSFDQYITEIEGLDIHFIHVKSTSSNAVPLLITHGWPGSVVEFHKVIKTLADPKAYGGNADDAFHVVCPSLPGYGFSGKPAKTGWGVEKIAKAWNILMLRLGYDRYFAQGGDWGSAVTTMIGIQAAGNCMGLHLNMPIVKAPKTVLENPGARDKRALASASYYRKWGIGYAKQQSTRPQTLGYALMDSPMGQAAWIIEKFFEWTDCDGHPENVLTRDDLIDNVMFYWLTGSGASSARLYWESFNRSFGKGGDNIVQLPTGCSIFPKEIVPTPRRWAEQRYKNIIYWNELKKGGHFAAFEQPEIFIGELRSCFRIMR